MQGEKMDMLRFAWFPDDITVLIDSKEDLQNILTAMNIANVKDWL